MGRPPKNGTVYEFAFYYRFTPGEDPPELRELLDAIVAARGRKRRDIIRAALLGGAGQARFTAGQVEDSAVSSLLDDMFADF
jgi:hypothetical protein